MGFRVLPLLWFLLLHRAAAKIEVVSLGNPFNDTSRSLFNLLGYSDIAKDALQITPDTSNADAFFVNKSGRIIYKKPYRIYESRDRPASSNETLVSSEPPKAVISFNSSFVFNIYPVKNKPVGEGFAFVIVPNGDLIPDNSHGEFLGLTNSSLDGNPKNQFFAVEFDTFKQSYDPDANHVGININSVRSIASRSLSVLNITLAPIQEDGVKYRAWVEYSGPLRRVEVYLSEWTKPKPDIPLLNATVDLSAYLAEKSYFGFSGSTGIQFQLNCVLSWNLTVEILQEKISSTPLSLFLKIGLPILAVLLLVAFYFGFRAFKKWRDAKRNEDLIDRITLRKFRYSELKEATRNFDVRNQLGRGGYGAVYRGVVPIDDVNVEVAVKKFLRGTSLADSIKELTMISQLRHRNLVRLIGWGHNEGKLLLVYMFMPNRSLDNHLYSVPPAPPLAWRRRVQILAGVASGLHYLHNECDETVVHHDIKTSNIMLDAKFNARLGDFGLARMIEDEQNSDAEVERGVVGTLGYIAPERFRTVQATLESDVFAFGIVILEVVCGRRPLGEIGGFKSLADWVWNMYQKFNIYAAVDARLGKKYDKEEAKKLLVLGLACSHPRAEDRPKMEQVLQVISGSAPPPQIPPMRPVIAWNPDGPIEYDDSGNTTQDVMPEMSHSRHWLHGQEYSGTAEFLSNPLR